MKPSEVVSVYGKCHIKLTDDERGAIETQSIQDDMEEEDVAPAPRAASVFEDSVAKAGASHSVVAADSDDEEVVAAPPRVAAAAEPVVKKVVKKVAPAPVEEAPAAVMKKKVVKKKVSEAEAEA